MSVERVAAPSLKYWRWTIGWSQAVLATKSGVSVSTIRKLEHGGSSWYRMVELLTDAIQLERAAEWDDHEPIDLTLPPTNRQRRLLE